VGLQGMGYDDRVFSSLSWFQGPWIASLRWRYFPDIRSGAAGRTPDTRLRGVHSSYSNFSLASGFNVNEFLSLRVGIDNLFDKLPPLQGGEPWREEESATDYNRAPTRAGGGVYDPLGRTIYFNASVRF